MKRLVIIDTISINNFHEVFNTSFLLGLCKDYQTITYYADRTAIDRIKFIARANNLEPILSNVRFKSLHILKGEHSVCIFIRMFLAIFINLYLLMKNRKSIVIFTTLNALFANILNYAIKLIKVLNIYIICHGELEYLISSPPFYKPMFLYKKLLFFFLNNKKQSEKIHFILLGENIKRNLLGIISGVKEKQIDIIKHPYIFPEKGSGSKVRKETIVIGTVGTVSKLKGFDSLVQLAFLLTDRILSSAIKIKVIGRHLLDDKEYPFLQFCSKKGLSLNTSEFNDEIETLDFILFFYPIDSYRLIASGALFDAIAHNKIIIALKNDYFESIFNEFGELGFLCDNINDMATCVIQLSENRLNVSYIYENIKSAKQAFTYDNLLIKLN